MAQDIAMSLAVECRLIDKYMFMCSHRISESEYDKIDRRRMDVEAQLAATTPWTNAGASALLRTAARWLLAAEPQEWAIAHLRTHARRLGRGERGVIVKLRSLFVTLGEEPTCDECAHGGGWSPENKAAILAILANVIEYAESYKAAPEAWAQRKLLWQDILATASPRN
ncbi:MAG: hypothetical protein WDN46_23790 [Methylocella sp.]